MKGGVKMCCHVSGVTGSRVGGIRSEVKVVVVEGVLTTLLEGKIGLMCDRQMASWLPSLFTQLGTKMVRLSNNNNKK